MVKKTKQQENDSVPIQDSVCIWWWAGGKGLPSHVGNSGASKLLVVFCLLGWLLDIWASVLFSLHDKDML